MIVTGYEPAGRFSITNSELDGRTSWSAQCNGQHYWTMLFLGNSDRITLAGNYIHHVSGRAPKVGGSGDITLHAVNNYFSEINGHAFDVATGGKVVIEGNVFENVKQPITPASASSGGTIYNAGGSGCQSYIGRSCQANTLSGSGTFSGYGSTSAFAKFSGYSVHPAIAASSVKASVLANAGVGKASSNGDGDGNTTTTPIPPNPTPTPTPETPTTTSTASPPELTDGSDGIKAGEQCGGRLWSGSGTCAAGLTCTYITSFYSVCR